MEEIKNQSPENQNSACITPVQNSLSSEVSQLASLFSEQTSFSGKAVVSYSISETLARHATTDKLSEQNQMVFNQAVTLEKLSLENKRFEFDKEMKVRKMALDEKEAERRAAAQLAKDRENPINIIANYINGRKSYTQLSELFEAFMRIYSCGVKYDGDMEKFMHQCVSVGDYETADMVGAFLRLMAEARNV